MRKGARITWGAPMLLLLTIACTSEHEAASSPYPTAEVTIGIHRIQVEVADTPDRMARGLSGRLQTLGAVGRSR